MNPKIDVTITDSHGDYTMLVSDNYEPYEVYVNNERFCTSERLGELGSENDKLRERIEWLEDELRKQGSAAHTFMAMARTYQEDNKKLRELCAEMFEAVKCCCSEWCTKTASNCDNNECGYRKFYVALRELGIEAE